MSDKKPIVDQELIRDLAKLLTETGLTEIEVERDDTRIRIVRAAVAAPTYVQAAAPALVPPAAVAVAAAEAGPHPGTILSPMVGTAYRSPEPGTRPFVDVGDTVREGQTVLIIEAMKTMNQIPAPRAGKVTAVMVDDAQPVEYGEPLMIIE
jgi:acetyl-CoA carboxylase biotin carboxyl carrier protein